MTTLTADTITDDQIRALQTEASEAGDIEQADLCSLALGYTPLIAWNLTPYAARIRCVDAINAARAMCEAENPLPAALLWARTAAAGEYLVEYEDDGLTDESDPGSRCGFGDDELAEIELVLGSRNLTLTADDRGLVARTVRS